MIRNPRIAQRVQIWYPSQMKYAREHWIGHGKVGTIIDVDRMRGKPTFCKILADGIKYFVSQKELRKPANAK